MSFLPPPPTIHKHVNNSCMATFAKPQSKPLYQTQIPSQIFISFTHPTLLRFRSSTLPGFILHSLFVPPHTSSSLIPSLITCPTCLLYHSYSHSSHPLKSYTHLNGLLRSQCSGKWSLSFAAPVFSWVLVLQKNRVSSHKKAFLRLH